MAAPTILLINGSLRAESFTTKLLSVAGSLLPDGYKVEAFDAVRALPYYNADLDTVDPERDAPDETVAAVRAKVAQADGLIIATPEYNGTVPGGLKNAVDWLSRPRGAHAFEAMPVAVLGAAPNPKGAAKAVDWLRTVLDAVGATVVGAPVAVGSVAERLGDADRFDDDVRAELSQLVADLIAAVEADPAD